MTAGHDGDLEKARELICVMPLTLTSVITRPVA